MKKKDALEKLWSELDANPMPEDMSARKAKLASLMAKLSDAAGAPLAAGAAKSAAAGWGRTALRYAWVPLAAAACVAAVVLLRTPAQPTPELLAEAVSKTTPICIQTPEKTPIRMQNHPILHTDAASTSVESAAATTNPAKTPEPAAPMCKIAPERTQDPEKPASHVQNDPDLHMAAAELPPGSQSVAPAPDPFAEAPAPQRRHRSLALSLFAAGGAGSSGTTTIKTLSAISVYPGDDLLPLDNYLGSRTDVLVTTDPEEASSGPGTTPGGSISFEDASGPVIGGNTTLKNQIHHDIPLNIGASLAYSITSRLAVETGVTYSYLHSNINRTTLDAHRHLHYMGIPLTLQYKVLDRRNLSAYLSGGGSAAYCLGGKIDRSDGKAVVINDHPVQLALTASAGADYRIAGPLCIFTEVAFNRYFNDGTGLETYYSQNPYAPSFKAGARITINKK